ncbi:TonB-dependent receptor [Roseomonas sp. NAR14]|uniref:TonB-dependent receptor n=1 Tax=Roseomonas acroporae TaxID=2937791 RepID=A0A9X1Y8P8_9PROT|nr:TonB-dependent receptor [Roseomonas acroporae]MCK8785541.1 TonB-dependent receptor [Roseomonas acroporae]
MALLLAGPAPARSQPAGILPETTVSAAPEALDAPVTASEGHVSRERLLARPITRPGELLEAVPGLIATQHSGEGKANQWFLRGFNLDHGTDLAITVDGMPVNMPTHGHGQGYADINFLIPELVRGLDYRLGPYRAQDGDFASAGAVRIGLVDSLPRPVVQGTVGSFGYWRGLAMTSQRVGQGNLLVAGEMAAYDGPWQVGDGLRRFNGVVRYSQGGEAEGFSLTAMGYANRWRSTDQVPLRALTEGLIGRFGTLNPTDGGNANRYSLSGEWHRTGDHGTTRVQGYAIRSTLDLFNDFTYFLDDPADGDQFHQQDRRWVLGLNVSHTVPHALLGAPSETEFGVQTRHDEIRLGLFRTRERDRLSTVRTDRVEQGSLGLYVENRTAVTPWLRTVLGLRGDLFAGRVRSDLAANAGSATEFLPSPKFGLVLGPWRTTELFLNGGFGFHSNDMRGVTITVDPTDRLTPLSRVPLLVRSRGAEIGLRTRPLPGLESTLSVFVLDFDSEILFVGDAGTTEASRPSRRIGVEWTGRWQPFPWLAFDTEIAATHARFTDADPAGDRIPGAPAVVASAGMTLGGPQGWYGGARFRYFGARPLVEDDSARSRPTPLVNARVGYAFANGIRAQLDVLNLLDARASQIDYFYTSRLAGEAPGGVADRHFHPVEPLALRFTLAASF